MPANAGIQWLCVFLERRKAPAFAGVTFLGYPAKNNYLPRLIFAFAAIRIRSALSLMKPPASA